MLGREIGFAGRRTAELLGAGDILRPWDEDGPNGLGPRRAGWMLHGEIERLAAPGEDPALRTATG